MKWTWYFVILTALLLSSCEKNLAVEDELFASLETEFSNKGANLKKETDKAEQLLIEASILDDQSWKARKKYLEFVAEYDSFPQVEDDSCLFELMLSPLNFQSIHQLVKEQEKQETFKASKFNAVLQKLESFETKDRTKPKIIAHSILNQLEDRDFEHPFYRKLIITLATDMQRGLLETNDIVKMTLSADLPPPGCNWGWDQYAFLIKFNDFDELMVRTKHLKSLDEISSLLYRWYTINKHLTRAQSRANIMNSQYKGYYFPFYSSISKIELEEAAINAVEELKEAKKTKDTHQDFIDFKTQTAYKWIKKLFAFNLLKQEKLLEIHPQTNIQIELEGAQRLKFKEKIYEQVYSGIDKIRNEDAEKHLNESYTSIKARNNVFRNDHQKLRLLEILAPLQVSENRLNYIYNNLPIEILEAPE